MVRTYKRKTKRTNIDEASVASAIAEVLNGNLSIRKAADKYNLKPATLQHRIEKKKQTEEKDVSRSFSSKYTSRQVFTREQELQLNEYIVKCSKMHHGLTLIQVRQLAYQYAKKINCSYPSSWDANKSAGLDWIYGYRKRNTNISLRKPENTSVARSFSFNKAAVEIFFNNLEDVLSRFNFTADRIINFDETGITTVLNAPKVLADKTQRQIGQIVSAERGELVTFGGIITGTGNTIPPVYVFPRVHYKSYFLNGASEGSLGLSSRSGWINSQLFIEVLKHIQKYTNSTKERPVLLICDNHESHISVEAINYSRDNGIVYLSFPPHTSHKLQPLDVGVFGPFKAKLKVAFNDWHINHPGKALSIYDIPNLAKLAFFESFTAKNITNAFARTGIVPFNKLAFSDEDFAPSEVFCSRESHHVSIEDSISNDTYEISTQQCPTPPELCIAIPSTSRVEGIYETSTSRPPTEPPIAIPSTPSAKDINEASPSKLCITPETVRPYPKITRQNTSKTGKARGKSRIYTDTPEKQRIEELQKTRDEANFKKDQRKRVKDMKTAKNLLGIVKIPLKKLNKKSNKATAMESDSSNCSNEIEFQESFDSEDSNMRLSDDDSFDTTPPTANDIRDGDFVVTKVMNVGKKQPFNHFVGKIIFKYADSQGNDFLVSFLKRKPTGTFVFPNIRDEASVNISDIVLKLPNPVVKKGTSRTASLFNFKINLSRYNIPI